MPPPHPPDSEVRATHHGCPPPFVASESPEDRVADSASRFKYSANPRRRQGETVHRVHMLADGAVGHRRYRSCFESPGQDTLNHAGNAGRCSWRGRMYRFTSADAASRQCRFHSDRPSSPPSAPLTAGSPWSLAVGTRHSDSGYGESVRYTTRTRLVSLLVSLGPPSLLWTTGTWSAWFTASV